MSPEGNVPDKDEVKFPDPEEFLRLEQRLGELADLLERYGRVRDQLTNLVQKLSDCTGELGSATRTVKDLGARVGDLVEAYRKCLPEEVLQRLEQIGGKIDATGRGLEGRIAEGVDFLAKSLQKVGDDLHRRHDELLAQGRELAQRIEELETATVKRLDALGGAVEQVNAAAKRIEKRLGDAEEVLEERIGEVAKRLKQVAVLAWILVLAGAAGAATWLYLLFRG